MAEPITTFTCWICGQPVSLENCKFEEHGQPVHEQCAVARIQLNNATRKEAAIPPRLRS